MPTFLGGEIGRPSQPMLTFKVGYEIGWPPKMKSPLRASKEESASQKLGGFVVLLGFI